MAELAAGVRAGEPRALARAISLVEDADPAAFELVREVYPDTGRAYAVGLTGPPGVGKSTLASALVGHVRAAGRTVGVISVDPSSPFTEGALLGDRIRLAEHFLDPGVFIRSMGTRGHGGGLAEATLQALLVLDASGKDLVLLETVGIGQSEIGVMSVADTVVLVLMPGSGDSVQALKAGIMEIPDVIVVEQARPPARGDDGERGSAGAARSARRATGGRPSCSPTRAAARASTSCGSRSRSTARTSSRRASSRSGGATQPRGGGVRGRLGARAPPSRGRGRGRSGAAAAPRRRRAP